MYQEILGQLFIQGLQTCGNEKAPLQEGALFRFRVPRQKGSVRTEISALR